MDALSQFDVLDVLKALGARRRTILMQFLIEAVSICLIGGTIGLVLAFGLFTLVAFSFPAFPVRFSPALVAVALIVSAASFRALSPIGRCRGSTR